MATTVWLDRDTHARLTRLKQARGLTSLGAVIRGLLDGPQPSAHDLYARRREEVDAVCKEYGVLRLVAFGSRARGDATAESDLDIAVEMAPGKSLFDFMHVTEALQQAFACPTDIIGRPTHRPRLMANIEKDGVVLYEAG